jgi:hypothetical protein
MVPWPLSRLVLIGAENKLLARRDEHPREVRAAEHAVTRFEAAADKYVEGARTRGGGQAGTAEDRKERAVEKAHAALSAYESATEQRGLSLALALYPPHHRRSSLGHILETLAKERIVARNERQEFDQRLREAHGDLGSVPVEDRAGRAASDRAARSRVPLHDRPGRNRGRETLRARTARSAPSAAPRPVSQRRSGLGR